MVKRLGIMGGSFDPIHNGHLGTAEALQEKLKLDEVLFIPAFISPFKQWKEAAPGTDRLAMVKLAIEGHPSWKATDMELKRTGVSYTYDTIEELKKQYGLEWELYFLTGADSVRELHKWYRIQDMLKLCTFVVATRPGYDARSKELKDKLIKNKLTNIIWVETPAIEISSTEVRAKVRNHESIDKFVPKAIVEYIRQRDLYRQ